MYGYSRPDPPLPSLIDQERFWRYVRVSALNECWPWRTDQKGMFFWRVDDELHWQASSRLAYRLAYGVSLPPDRVVAHSCDFKACCNPLHLSLETQRKNTQDAVDRGLNPYLLNENYKSTRQAAGAAATHHSGDKNPFARHSNADVAEMRRLREVENMKLRDIANRFGTSKQYVWAIVNYKARKSG